MRFPDRTVIALNHPLGEELDFHYAAGACQVVDGVRCQERGTVHACVERVGPTVTLRLGEFQQHGQVLGARAGPEIVCDHCWCWCWCWRLRKKEGASAARGSRAYAATDTALIVFVDAVADDRALDPVKEANFRIRIDRLSRAKLTLYRGLPVVLFLREFWED